MSLINDALKKAQKQRTGESPSLDRMPGIGGESAARIAKHDKASGFNSPVAWVAAGAVGLLILIAGGFFMVRWLTRPAQTPPSLPPVAVAQPARPVPPAVAAPAAPAAPAVEKAAGPVAAPVSPPAPTNVEPPVISVVKTQPVAAAPAPKTETVEPAVPAKMDPDAMAFIDAIRVTGIRASTIDAKVLMNDRVYRVGDAVDHQLGIKLVVITAGALTFEDEHGARYTRNF